MSNCAGRFRELAKLIDQHRRADPHSPKQEMLENLLADYLND